MKPPDKRTTNLACTNVTKVGMFPIPLPKVKEQEQLIEFLDARLNQLRKTCCRLSNSQIATLTAYRKSLIHECVTGQRRVTEEDLRRAERVGSISTVDHRP